MLDSVYTHNDKLTPLLPTELAAQLTKQRSDDSDNKAQRYIEKAQIISSYTQQNTHIHTHPSLSEDLLLQL
jgi:hypothetical protein